MFHVLLVDQYSCLFLAKKGFEMASKARGQKFVSLLVLLWLLNEIYVPFPVQPVSCNNGLQCIGFNSSQLKTTWLVFFFVIGMHCNACSFFLNGALLLE
jgi:hypothetical protein